MRVAHCVAIVLIGTLLPAFGREQALHVELLHPPWLVETTEGRRLAYELHFTNFSAAPIRVDWVTITVGTEYGHRIERSALRSALSPVEDDTSPLDIERGRRAVLYVDLFDMGDVGGQRVAHEIGVTKLGPDRALELTIPGPTVSLGTRKPVVLGPPLGDGNWVGIYDPRLARGHRRVFYATEGEAVLPGRFAIDFVKITENGSLVSGDANVASNHYAFGEPVLAVADGIVAALRDDVPDPRKRSGRERPTIGDASGNYLALRMAEDRYVFYEHLRQGAPVRVGQFVKRGDVIGHVGFTGQASEPHLHLHVADRRTVLGAEGQPFVFDRVEVRGGYRSIADIFDEGTWTPSKPARTYKKKFPAPNRVLRFGGRTNRSELRREHPK